MGDDSLLLLLRLFSDLGWSIDLDPHLDFDQYQ